MAKKPVIKKTIARLSAVNWEFRPLEVGSNKLTLQEPAEIRIFYNYQSNVANNLKINGVLKMDGYNNFTVGGIAQKYPFELVIVNNKNEIDTTNYEIQLPAGDEAIVYVKYLLPPETC